MVQLVFLLDAAQDADRVLDRRLAHEHRLEAPRQRRVLLDVLAVFVERGRADAVQRAARQLRLQQVGRVHRAVGPAGADQRVHLVDEQDDLAVARLDLLQHRLQPLLELAAELRAGHHRAEVERQQPLALQRLRHVAVDDAQREALDDRGLADAGLADQHRVVLGAAREHLDGAADLLVAADHRVELALAGDRGDVAGVFLQRVEILLGVRAGHLAALADVVHRPLERLRGGAGGAQRALGHAARAGERHQQAVLRDIVVAGALGRLLRRIQHADQLGRGLRLAGAAALHLRHAGDLGIDLAFGDRGVPARRADQPGGGAFLVVEQRLQQVLGGDPLVEFADGDRLGGLQEAARPLGEFLNIHGFVPNWQATGRPSPLSRQRGRDRCTERW